MKKTDERSMLYKAKTTEEMLFGDDNEPPRNSDIFREMFLLLFRKNFTTIMLLLFYILIAILTFPKGPDKTGMGSSDKIIRKIEPVRKFLDSRSHAYYTIRSNDTFAQIALYFRTSLRSLLKENPELAPNLRELKIGSKVRINLKEVR